MKDIIVPIMLGLGSLISVIFLGWLAVAAILPVAFLITLFGGHKK